MAYIIDGHNLIGVLPDIQLADPDDETRLLARLRAFRARARTGPMLVVFDPSPLGGMPGRQTVGASTGVSVRFAEPGQTADDAIVAFLRGVQQPGQYAVVTDDQELILRARALGASVIRASDFAVRLLPGAQRPAHKAAREEMTPDDAPDPHAAAYADIYAGFMSAEKTRTRFAGEEPADVSIWIERLYGDDVGEAQNAARWLGQHGGENALDPLSDATTHSDARVRAAALLALGDLGDRRALPALCDRLENDSASLARQAAAQSLGRIGNHSVEGALEIAARADPKGKVRKAAREGLAQVRARPPGLRHTGRGGAKPPS